MSNSAFAPKIIKVGLVLIDPNTSAVIRIIALQYNPDTLTRTLQPQGASEGADRGEVFRIKGPPTETIKLDAEIDAADQLEAPEQNQNAAQFGIAPQLAALETIVYPASAQLQSNNALAQNGTLEIIPMESPLALFVWSKQRILPVRITDFSITEEAFDAELNPIRAKVTLGMRVLSVNDLSFNHKGAGLYMVYQQQKERLARMARAGERGSRGSGSIG